AVPPTKPRVGSAESYQPSRRCVPLFPVCGYFLNLKFCRRVWPSAGTKTATAFPKRSAHGLSSVGCAVLGQKGNMSCVFNAIYGQLPRGFHQIIKKKIPRTPPQNHEMSLPTKFRCMIRPN